MKKIAILALAAMTVMSCNNQNNGKANAVASEQKDSITITVDTTSTEKTAEQQAGVKAVYDFMTDAGVFYVSTVDGDRPQVRPFSSVNIYQGNLYIFTGKKKNVGKQIQKNPRLCIVAFKDGKWMRINAVAAEDTRVAAKQAMLDHYPGEFDGMYTATDANIFLLKLTNVEATDMSTNKVYKW